MGHDQREWTTPAVVQGGKMAIEAKAIPEPAPRLRLEVVRPGPEPETPRRARFVNVHRSAEPDGTWTCNCICGWNGRRLRFPHEDAANRAGELHLRVCAVLNR
jgi:hypothetical protein